MALHLGLKALRRLCEDQNPLAWHKNKLSGDLFNAHELPAYEWVAAHLKTHHALPKPETLIAQFPDCEQVQAPEPCSYYVNLLENRFYHWTINQANLDSQQALKIDQDAHEKAAGILRQALNAIAQQKFRLRITNVGKEAKQLILSAYHNVQQDGNASIFGWPYMDKQAGGAMPGDVVSFVGRPASGKTYLSLWTAIQNWKNKTNVLFVSMEMMTLPIVQRITALYAHTNIQQLKMAAYSSQTFKKFLTNMTGLELEQAKFYVVDGNLATCVEDVFTMADMLECQDVVIDGAYLLRHKNARLDRYTRTAENVELIKRYCTDLDICAFCSWQFNREATRKVKKGFAQDVGLEDLGSSDAIGQISSVVLGLFQEDGVETMKNREIRVLKGRNGEVGTFRIAWNFILMDFSQHDPSVSSVLVNANEECQWV